MMSFRQVRKFSVIVISTLMLIATIVFNFGTPNAQAATFPEPFTTQLQFGTMNRAEAMTKSVEGKAQEALGNATGDPKDEIMGDAKQFKSQIHNTAEDLEDQVQLPDREEVERVPPYLKGVAEDLKDQVQLPDRAKAAAKNVEGKIQETVGNVTGSSEDQMMGRIKQAEGTNRNIIENVKDSIGNLSD